MSRAWTCVQPPAVEPVWPDEAALHLREDSTDPAVAGSIAALITAARQYVEESCGISLVTQEWELRLDGFPPGRDPILIPRPPLIEVVSVSYVAESGEAEVWAPDQYRVATAGVPGRVTLAHGAAYPIAQAVSGAVTVRYAAGFGDADDVPHAIRQAMLLLIGNWYTNREAEFVGTVVGRLSFAVNALLAPYKVYGFG